MHPASIMCIATVGEIILFAASAQHLHKLGAILLVVANMLTTTGLVDQLIHETIHKHLQGICEVGKHSSFPLRYRAWSYT